VSGYQLDLSAIYARDAPTGVFSSRKIEKATYESLPFRFIARNLHPDYDTPPTRMITA